MPPREELFFPKKGKCHVQLVSWNVRGFYDYAKSDCKFRKVDAFLQDICNWDICLEHKLDRNKIEDMRLHYQVLGDVY